MHLPAWLKAIIDFLPPRTPTATTPKAEEHTMSEPLASTVTVVSSSAPAAVPTPVASTTTTTTTSIDATTGKTIFHTIVADAEAVVAKVEDEFHAIEADLGIGGQDTAAQAPTTTSTPSADIVQKVGELLALAGRTPVAYAQVVDLAIAAVGTDTDTVLAKIKDLLAYSGSKVDVWDQVVALAKAV